MNERAAFRRALRDAPGSIRALADEAGVSDTLLRAIRDGNRRLTANTRQAVFATLRRWEARTSDAADALEAADLASNGTGTDE